MSGLMSDFQLSPIPDEQVKTPNMTAEPDQMTTSNIMPVIDNAVKQTVTKKAANKTILSGLRPEQQPKAVESTASDIMEGNKEPGFFDGIMSGIGSLLQQPATQMILSGLAGEAIARTYGVNTGAGAIQGMVGGMQQQQNIAKLGLESQKAQQEFNLKERGLDLEEQALNLKREIEETKKATPKSVVRRETDASPVAQQFIQMIDTLSPEDAKKQVNNLIRNDRFKDLQPWEKTLITERLSKKAFGGSLDRLFASVAETE
jgi:hypothetical protein